MTCAICRKTQATAGILCNECQDRLAGPTAIRADRIVPGAKDNLVAALIDRWGRANLMTADTVIGRDLGKVNFAILDGSVSKRHASIRLEKGVWTLRDLGSRNGTLVNGHVVKDNVMLKHGDWIWFGMFKFFFLDDLSILQTIG